jgi:hypothetical protein
MFIRLKRRRAYDLPAFLQPPRSDSAASRSPAALPRQPLPVLYFLLSAPTLLPRLALPINIRTMLNCYRHLCCGELAGDFSSGRSRPDFGESCYFGASIACVSHVEGPCKMPAKRRGSKNADYHSPELFSSLLRRLDDTMLGILC